MTLQLTGMVTIDKEVTVRGSSGKFSDVVIRGGGAAGVVNITDPGAVLSSVTICNGAGTGGGVRLDGGGMVTNCRITASVETEGSGIGIYNNNGKVLDCVFDNLKVTPARIPNTGDRRYDGLAIYQTGANALTDRCVVTNCFSPIIYAHGDSYHAAMVVLAGGAFRNSLVAWNNAGLVMSRTAGSFIASALYAAGESRVDNCTFFANHYQGSSGGLMAGVRTAGAALVRNSIILDCGNGFEDVTDYAGDASSFQHVVVADVSGVTDGVAAQGDVVVPALDGSLQLPVGSVACNAGDTLDWMDASSTDLLGNPRVAGGAPDIGCAELPATLACSFAASQEKGVGDFTATLTPTVAGTAAGGATYEWLLNGSVKSTVAGPYQQSFLYDVDFPYGDYALTLRVTGAGQAVATFSRRFTFAPATVYATNGNANAAYPYATPATAAGSVQAAVDAAYDGTEVVILPSATVYNQGATIRITRNIVLRGATDDFLDVVLSGNSQRRTLQIDSPNAVVRDLTVRAGAGTGQSYTGGGSNVRMRGGELRNCRVTASVGGDKLFGEGVWCDNGRIVRCLIDGNTHKADRAAGVGIFAIGGATLIDSCTITNNKCSTGFYADAYYRAGAVSLIDGTIRNSLVAGANFKAASSISALSATGIYAYDATVDSCSIVGNKYESGQDTDLSALNANGATTVVNTLSDGNTDPSATAYANYQATAGSTLRYCATMPLADGEGNREAADGDWALDDAGRIFITFDSKLRNKGAFADWMSGATDLYGGRRLVGNSVDIGCYECQLLPGTIIYVR